MKLCAVDLETYWSDNHSVGDGENKLPPDVYAMHPETEIISCSFVWKEPPEGSPKELVLFGEEDIREYIGNTDFTSDTIAIGHNMAEFDALFLAWRLNFKPALWADTLAMARQRYGTVCGLSLAKLVSHFGIGEKDRSALYQTKGKKLADFSDKEREQMTDYNIKDSRLCLDLFRALMEKNDCSKVDLVIIDQTIRMLVNSQVELDQDVLRSVVTKDVAEREKAMEQFAEWIIDAEGEQADVKECLNDPKTFATFLSHKYNVDPPTKPDPNNPNRVVYAFGKGDEPFWKALEKENPLVETARKLKLETGGIGHQSRIERMIQADDLSPTDAFPVPIRYAEGVNGQDAGWNGYNMLNMPRINGSPSDAIRQSIVPPSGKTFIGYDMVGMQLRICHTLFQVEESMVLFQDFPENADLYRDFAARHLAKKPIEEISDKQREIGKVAQLQLMFGSGGGALFYNAKSKGVVLEWHTAQKIVDRWRQVYKPIVDGWKVCQEALARIIDGEMDVPLDPWGLCKASALGLREFAIETPGSRIFLNDLQAGKDDKGQVQFNYAKRNNKGRIERCDIYGAKMVQYIVSNLQKQVMIGNDLKLKAMVGLDPALRVHDERLYSIPISGVPPSELNKSGDEGMTYCRAIEKVTRTAPTWWPELVVWSNVNVGENYGEIKG